MVLKRLAIRQPYEAVQISNTSPIKLSKKTLSSLNKTKIKINSFRSEKILENILKMPPVDTDNGIKIMAKSIVCEESTLRGDITIQPGCVIHPSATIIADGGPIILGENCIVEEYATIHYRLPENTSNSPSEPAPPLTIGVNNVFEVGCTVEANRIGDKNVFECKSYVGPEISVSSGCIIGAGVRLQCKQQLPENTVIYGRDSMQREAIDKHASQTLQIDFLRKVLPNYHHLRKHNYDPKKSRTAM